MVRVLLPSMVGSSPCFPCKTCPELTLAAEFRGPGVHHNFDDSDNDYNDNKQSKAFGLAGYRGRIIFLGDGTEVLTDSDDTEMFDNAEEDKDLASQVSRSSSATTIAATSSTTEEDKKEETKGGKKKTEIAASASAPATSESGSCDKKAEEQTQQKQA